MTKGHKQLGTGPELRIKRRKEEGGLPERQAMPSAPSWPVDPSTFPASRQRGDHPLHNVPHKRFISTKTRMLATRHRLNVTQVMGLQSLQEPSLEKDDLMMRFHPLFHQPNDHQPTLLTFMSFAGERASMSRAFHKASTCTPSLNLDSHGKSTQSGKSSCVNTGYLKEHDRTDGQWRNLTLRQTPRCVKRAFNLDT